MNTLHLNVLDVDIDNGARFNSTSCPLALAARRSIALRGVFISVGSNKITIHTDNDKFYAELPEDVRHWVKEFDSEEPVRPFQVELSVVTEKQYWDDFIARAQDKSDKANFHRADKFCD